MRPSRARDRILPPHPRHWPRLLVLHLALAAGALPGLLELEIDNPARRFFPRDAAARARYERFSETFGEPELVRVVVSGPALWTASGAAWLRTLERRSATLPGALATAGLYRHHKRPPEPWPPDGPLELRRRASREPLDRALGWIGADGEAASVLLIVRRLDSGGRERLFAELAELLAEAPPGVDNALAGVPVLERAFDREIASFSLRNLPLLTLLVLLLLWLGFRDARELLPPLALATFCELTAFGAMGYLGRPVDLISVLLGPVLLVLAVATALHVQIRFRRHRLESGGATPAILATYREKRWPLLATGVTTLAGFGSLAASPVPVVRAFGLWAAGGVGLITVAAFSLLPALLAVTGDRGGPRPVEKAFERFGHRTGSLAARRRGRVLLLFALPLAAAVAGLPRLRAESGLIDYFPAEHPVRAALADLARHGIGAAAAELWIELPGGAGGSFDSAALHERLAELAAAVSRQPGVLGVASAAALPWPPERSFDRLARRLLVSEDGRIARLSIAIPMLGVTELTGLTESAEAAARGAFPGAVVWTTGRYPLIVASQQTMLRTLLAALLWTVLTIAAVLALLLRSARATLLLLAPNLWPVVVTLGAMAWLEIPLGGNTVMVGAIILGLAVDDTVHFLGDFRRTRRDAGAAIAVARTLERTAAAHLSTTLVLVAGFASIALARFAPVAQAGLLIALGLVAALAADLYLLPALLGGGGGSGEPRGRAPR